MVELRLQGYRLPFETEMFFVYEKHSSRHAAVPDVTVENHGSLFRCRCLVPPLDQVPHKERKLKSVHPLGRPFKLDAEIHRATPYTLRDRTRDPARFEYGT